MTLHAELTGPPKGGCHICMFLKTLYPGPRDEWVHELSLPVTVVGNARVVDALHRRGVVIDEASVRRHRRNHNA